MALSQTTPPTTLANELVTITEVLATSIDNVTGSSSGKLYFIEVDNTENEHGTYLKIADAASATAGTTQPQFRLLIPKLEKVTFSLLDGHTYSAGISLWATTGASVGSTAAPTNSLIVKLLVTT